jgi:hypothetical protein
MVKPYDQYLAEDLAGEYCYYGPGSLLPLITKLAGEGKDAAFVYRYLTSLGVDEARKRHVIAQVYGAMFEGQVFEDEVDDLLSAEVEYELSGKKKGKEGKEDKEDKEDKDGEKEDEGDEEDGDEEEDKPKDSDQTALLKRVLKDQGKLDKIRSILKESGLLVIPAGAELNPVSVRLLEAALRSDVSMGGGERPYHMFYWSGNASDGSFLMVGSDEKSHLVGLAETLGIQEYYIYKRGYPDLTKEGGAEFLEQWSGPDDSFVSNYPGAMAKRISARRLLPRHGFPVQEGDG